MKSYFNGKWPKEYQRQSRKMELTQENIHQGITSENMRIGHFCAQDYIKDKTCMFCARYKIICLYSISHYSQITTFGKQI